MPDASHIAVAGTARALDSTRAAGGVRRGRARVSDEIFVGIVAAVDALLIAAVAAATYAVYFGLIVEGSTADPRRFAAATVLGIAIALQRFTASRLYRIETLRDVKQQVARVLAGWTAAVVLLLVAGFLLKISDEFSRVWFVSWYLGTASALITARAVTGGRLRRWAADGRFARAAAVVGAGPLGQNFVECSLADPGTGLRILGLFDDRTTRVAGQVRGVAHLGKVDDLVAYARRTKIDTVVIALPLSADQRIMEVIAKLRALPVDIRLLSDAMGFQLAHRPVSYPAGIPALNVVDRPIVGWGFVAKRGFDIALAGLGLLALSPFLAAIALAIKWDSPGPALFRQKRLGFNNEMFEIVKFRTMRMDATDADAERLVTRGDARVTRLGRFLRKTSLDELPQLWNVVRGDMSLVGPRPHALKAKAADTLYDEAVAEYAARHRVKPGITGWAQVNGWRGETDTLEKIRKRVEHDLYYIDNWSLGLDVRIILLTIIHGVGGRNAF